MARCLVMFVAVALLVAGPAFGQVSVPEQPRSYVEDLANVIDAQHEQLLKGVLQELEQKTGAQYIILTVDTTGNKTIEEFAVELAHDKWKLGGRDEDNGLLFVFAARDRLARFEVGYGLEGFVTDRYSGEVGRQVLKPYLQRGQYSEGIYQANLQVVQKIATEAGVTLTGMPMLPRSSVRRLLFHSRPRPCWWRETDHSIFQRGSSG